ncbi:PD40 domain-containing protein [bacterium]|nr:PD40 domain-containing protein [bacterium]
MRISSSVLWLASAYLLSGCSGSSSPPLSASDSSSSSASVSPRLSSQEPAVLARTLTPITQITQQALDGSGRYMVFSSTASNLVSGDNNGVADVFLYDRYLRVHKRISLGGGAVEANGASYRAVISADARYVVYDSLASNLVSGDTNQRTDVFVYDRNNNTTTRVSQKGGVQGNGASDQAAVSGDGNLIAFRCASTNLSLNDNNRASDIFVWNRSTGQLDRVTDLSRESLNPFLSADGNWLSYDSNASGRYQVYRRALGTGPVTQLTTSTLGDSYGAAMNRDGSMVAFTSSASDLVAGDSNGFEDIFVWSASETVRIGGNGRSSMPSLSADGSLLAFVSSASDLLGGDSNGVADAYLTVLDGTRRIWRQSVAADNLGQPGAQADQESAQACIDPTGAVVAFRSYAIKLDPADSNGSDDDLFLRDFRIQLHGAGQPAAGGPGQCTASGCQCRRAGGRFSRFLWSLPDLRRRPLRGFLLQCQQSVGQRRWSRTRAPDLSEGYGNRAGRVDQPRGIRSGQCGLRLAGGLRQWPFCGFQHRRLQFGPRGHQQPPRCFSA